MPPVADTPSKPPKWHRRKTRNSSVPQDTIDHLSDSQASRHVKSDLDLPDRGIEATPISPPVASSPGPNRRVLDGHRGSVEDNGKHKQTPRKNQGGRHIGSSPLPKLNSTPQVYHRTDSLTPGKKNITPSQAYAGPTFHASPAASSLPMPRFFSRSVPEVNEGPSMQSTMEKETTETSSEQSEGSPTPAFAQRVGEEQAREESPLDIFFKADREQKERQRKEQKIPLGVQNPSNPTIDPGRPRYHSRHSTNGSMGALFPMELENKEPTSSHEKALSDPITSTMDVNDSSLASSAERIETPEQAERRKAKTIALKKLLLSSVPLESESPPSNEQVSESDDTLHKTSSPQQQKRTSSSQIHKQIAAQTARQMSPCPRAPSNLREEISASALPESGQLPELPITPTPSRTRNAYKSVLLEGEVNHSVNGASSPSPTPNSSKRSTPVPTEAAVHSSPYKAMEDDLRRILKLNVLSSDGATGIQS